MPRTAMTTGRQRYRVAAVVLCCLSGCTPSGGDAGRTDGGGDAAENDGGEAAADAGTPVVVPSDGGEPTDAGVPAPAARTLVEQDYQWLVDANKGTLAQLDNMAAYLNFNRQPDQPAYWDDEARRAALSAVAFHRYDIAAGVEVTITSAYFDGNGIAAEALVIEVSASLPFDVRAYPSAPVFKSNPTRVFVHYMPWFEAQPTDGYWGLHWTMATQDPEVTDAEGRRQIASHFYPSIGPYGSSDPDLIEYHSLLMKLAGIDGVLIDWYGTFDINDYAGNLDNSDAFIDATDSVGLEFGIVYEDRTTEVVVQAGLASSAVDAAVADFSYMRDTYFTRPNYIVVDEQPLVLTFTPVHIETPAAWSQVFSAAAIDPTFLPLWGQEADVGDAGDGSYAWFHGGADYLTAHSAFAAEAAGSENVALPSAFPGFEDFYAEGGWGDGIDFEIAHNGSATLQQMLQVVDDANLDMVQLVTWNDFGEGTMIEPTEELGYAPLNAVHAFAGVELAATWLPEPERLYRMRKAHLGDELAQLQLDQVAQYLRSLQLARARALLDRVADEP